MNDTSRHGTQHTITSPWIAWGIGALLLVLVVVLGLSIGAVSIAMRDVVDALRGIGDPSTIAIVRDLRAPRVLLAALVGAGLASSGGALQGTLRNPLAEPYLLGVSGGAAVGAVTAMAFGVVQPALVTACAFAGAAIATIVVTAIARVVGGGADTKLLLMAANHFLQITFGIYHHNTR